MVEREGQVIVFVWSQYDGGNIDTDFSGVLTSTKQVTLNLFISLYYNKVFKCLVEILCCDPGLVGDCET